MFATDFVENGPWIASRPRRKPARAPTDRPRLTRPRRTLECEIRPPWTSLPECAIRPRGRVDAATDELRRLHPQRRPQTGAGGCPGAPWRSRRAEEEGQERAQTAAGT